MSVSTLGGRTRARAAAAGEALQEPSTGPAEAMKVALAALEAQVARMSNDRQLADSALAAARAETAAARAATEALRLTLGEAMDARAAAQAELAGVRAEIEGVRAQLAAERAGGSSLQLRLAEAIAVSGKSVTFPAAADPVAYEIDMTNRDINGRPRVVLLKPVKS